MLFPNYYVPPVVPARLGRVVTVLHDLQYRHYPAYFTATKQAWLRASQAWATRRADRIVVLSEFVRRDAAHWLGSNAARKLTVIPNPISWDRFAAASTPARPLPQRYILSVAAQYPHKNLATLLRAFALLAAGDSDLRLVLCGQFPEALRGIGGIHASLPDLARALGIADRLIQTGYIDDTALGTWYHHAEVFAFPSLFEGFGMPPVEALGFGLPVITTGCTALPEVTRGLARLVSNPLDAAEWAAMLATVLRDPVAGRPSPRAVQALRAHYAPHRIARLYRDVLAGR